MVIRVIVSRLVNKSLFGMITFANLTIEEA